MDFNGDTYQKLPVQQQQNPLDTIAKVQGIQRNNLAIDKDKLELFNKKYDIVERGLGNLVNEPELTADHFIKTYQNFVNVKAMTPEQGAMEMSSLPTMSAVKRDNPQATPDQQAAIYNQKLRQLAEVHLLNSQERKASIDHYAGQVAQQNTGDQLISGNQGMMRATGHGITPSPFSSGSYTPLQQPPGQTGVDKNNNPIFKGANTTPPSVTPVGNNPLPVAPNRVGEAASNKERVNDGVADFRPAPSQNFEEGKRMYNEDIALATNRLTQAKPAQQALKLMTPEVLSGLTGTGPIADKLTKVISAVGGVLGLPEKIGDKVAARQEIVKKMSKYVSDSPIAGRSDAAQTLAEASSPNPNAQSLKALVNLTRDAIAADRAIGVRAPAFEGNDYSKYPLHRAASPNIIDNDALKLDLMSPEERKRLQEEVKGRSKAAQDKFQRTYQLGKKLNMYE